jgi:hypothetical protein
VYGVSTLVLPARKPFFNLLTLVFGRAVGEASPVLPNDIHKVPA